MQPTSKVQGDNSGISALVVYEKSTQMSELTSKIFCINLFLDTPGKDTQWAFLVLSDCFYFLAHFR